MIFKEHEGLRWSEFEIFTGLPLVHGCFTRHGGVSVGTLESLNLGRCVGDTSENVNQNYERLTRSLSLTNIACAKICHGSQVTRLTSVANREMPISDGLTTSLPNFCLIVTQADCQAAIFYDPVHHVLANVHCGWRSSVQNIYAETVDFMKASYGTNPNDLLVGISPSLGPKNAEFLNYRTELPELFWDFKIKDNYFDFWAISRWQLERAGVLSNHIEVAEIDTYSHSDYFSFRCDKKCGRQATICALLNPN